MTWSDSESPAAELEFINILYISKAFTRAASFSWVWHLTLATLDWRFRSLFRLNFRHDVLGGVHAYAAKLNPWTRVEIGHPTLYLPRIITARDGPIWQIHRYDLRVKAATGVTM